MRFCPNCGTKIDVSRGIFCPECGQKIPVTIAQPSTRIAKKDGWTIMAETAMKMNYAPMAKGGLTEPRRSDKPIVCDFRRDDYESLSTCIYAMGDYLDYVAVNLDYRSVQPLIQEFNHDVVKYEEMCHECSYKLDYPPPFAPFLLKLRQYFSNAITALYDEFPDAFDGNIRTLKLYINTINVVNEGAYNRKLFYGEFNDGLMVDDTTNA
ncbi:MAG: zinc ribbon domain-containing protein [Muribaculaceae bacterium]|nr:zinc ribbon domain-containing protein [Muribaculaceae bacterium]